MKIKELKEAIANLPDDGEVFVQRIEDYYFEGERGWSVKLMEGEKYNNLPERITKQWSQEDLDFYKEQYIDTHCCINYDGKNLYITSHY